MSTLLKVTFGALCAFAVALFIGINYLQKAEQTAIRQGPIKDAQRIAEKLKKQLANEKEAQIQADLRQKFEAVQPVSAEIIEGKEK